MCSSSLQLDTYLEFGLGFKVKPTGYNCVCVLFAIVMIGSTDLEEGRGEGDYVQLRLVCLFSNKKSCRVVTTALQLVRQKVACELWCTAGRDALKRYNRNFKM